MKTSESKQWDVVRKAVWRAQNDRLMYTREYFLATWNNESEVSALFPTWPSKFCIAGRIASCSMDGNVTIENTCHLGIRSAGPDAYCLSNLDVTIEEVDLATAYRKLALSRAMSKVALRRFERPGGDRGNLLEFYKSHRVKRQT